VWASGKNEEKKMYTKGGVRSSDWLEIGEISKKKVVKNF
jgi:hypothetical protein